MPEEKSGSSQITVSKEAWFSSWWKSSGVLAVGLIGGLGFLAFFVLFARPVALFILAVAIAAALAPLANRLARRIPRTLAIVALYGGLFLFIVGVMTVLLTPVVAQASDFIERIPDIAQEIGDFLAANGVSTQVDNNLTSQLVQAAQGLINTPLTIFSGLLEGLLVLIVSVYLLIDTPKIRRFILSLFHPDNRAKVDQVGLEMMAMAGGYVRGVAINVVVVSTITTVVLMLIGMPFALVLGVTAGLFEVFPVVGSFLGAAPIMLVALWQSPTTALVALICVLIIQQLQGNVITPKVMKDQAKVPQFIVPLVIVGGAGVGGVLGALIAVPLVAMTRVFIERVIVPAIRRATGASGHLEQPIP
ncbi:MAG: AI-2E family transporter [Anaerolineae bacterium]|nr:AI-2E family transporter [Anaerolineae bacterium]